MRTKLFDRLNRVFNRTSIYFSVKKTTQNWAGAFQRREVRRRKPGFHHNFFRRAGFDKKRACYEIRNFSNSILL